MVSGYVRSKHRHNNWCVVGVFVVTEFAGPKNDGPSEGRGSEQYRLFYPITIEDQLATLKTANTTPGEISARGEYFSNEMAAAFSDSLPNILIRTASCPEKPFFFKNGVPGEATCCQVELRAGDKFYLPIGNGIVTENPTLVVAEQAHSTASTAFTPHFSPAAFLELSTKQTSDPEFCEYLREIGEVALQNTRQRSWPGIDALLVSDVCPGTAPTHWIASTPLGKFDLLVLLDGTGQIACSAWDHLNIPQIETALCSESVARWPRTAFVLELAAAFKKMLPPEVLTTGVKLGSPVEDVMQKADLVRISGGSLLCKIPEGAEACSIILDLKLPLLQIPDPDAV